MKISGCLWVPTILLELDGLFHVERANFKGWMGGPSGFVNFGDASYVSTNVPILVSYIKKSSTWDIFANGSFVRSVSDSSSPTYPDAHDWVLGDELNSSPVYYFQGLIAQVFVCEEALKNGQRKKVEKEIMAYWGL